MAVSQFFLMQPISQEKNTDLSIRANAFPSRSAGGLLWVFMGKENDTDNLPPLFLEALPTLNETAGSIWIFNRNPISYVSMMENTLDPAHSPWTHEQMVGFGGLRFSPDDAVPMARYDTRKAPSIGGFSLEHTPYQNSTAKVAGADFLTVRTFFPPCTMTVASPPFFQTRMWFVPADTFETNVISFFFTPSTPLIRWTKKLPRIHELIKDTKHTLQYLGDWNYRFLSQDRITMQGQDERKVGEKLKDLTPTPSGTGVATFQNWLLKFAKGGPFAAENTGHANKSGDRLGGVQNFFSRELSFWESHGKYCPQCQRSVKRMASAKKWALRGSRKLLLASIVSGLAAGGTSMSTKWRHLTTTLCAVTINLIVIDIGFRRFVSWCGHKEKRMHGVGADLWMPHESVFQLRNQKN